MKPIKFLNLLCVLLIVPVMFFASCEKKPKDKNNITIGLVVPSLSHPFFVHLKENVLDESEKLGVKIIAADAEDAAAKQMSIIEDFIARGVDGVLMSPIGTDALVPAVELLNRAKIPVATVDRKVSGGNVLVHVGADNVEGGRVAARYIIEKLEGKGNIIELEGTPGTSPAIDRKKGFEEVIAKSKMKIVASQTGEFYRAKGQSVMENLLQVQKNFQAVYAANDEMMLGALEAMEAQGINTSNVTTIGYDAVPDALEYITQGKLTASIEQFPGEQSRKALKILVDFIRNGRMPQSNEIYIKPIAIDKSNLDKAERKN